MWRARKWQFSLFRSPYIRALIRLSEAFTATLRQKLQSCEANSSFHKCFRIILSLYITFKPFSHHILGGKFFNFASKLSEWCTKWCSWNIRDISKISVPKRLFIILIQTLFTIETKAESERARRSWMKLQTDAERHKTEKGRTLPDPNMVRLNIYILAC